jgi:hypothetical protein
MPFEAENLVLVYSVSFYYESHLVLPDLSGEGSQSCAYGNAGKLS